MNLNVQSLEGAALVAVAADNLDAGNSAEFKRAMAPLIEAHKRIVLDLAALTFVDSSGLGALISCLRQISNGGGELKLVNMSKSVRTLFELVRMHRVFDIYNSPAEALRTFRPA